MSQAKHERILLPEGWWERFVELYQELGFRTLEDFCADTGYPNGTEPTLSTRTLYRAKNSTDPKGQITADVFDILLMKLDLRTRSELLNTLRSPSADADPVTGIRKPPEQEISSGGDTAAMQPKEPQVLAILREEVPPRTSFYRIFPFDVERDFVPRPEKFQLLTDWARSPDHPVLLVQAIGGSGKSMLCWQWLEGNAGDPAGDWTGVIWYSFYDIEANVTDFCQRAVAYLSGGELSEWRKVKGKWLLDKFFAELKTQRCLIVLDGLERLLSAYHRLDASHDCEDEISESVESHDGKDSFAIRPEDDEFLRELIRPSKAKILITSRLLPSRFLNRSDCLVPGVRREFLGGLSPEEAEEMAKGCGIKSSPSLKKFLQDHWGCNPLAVGAVAGMVRHYASNPGNFEMWLADPDHGAGLDLDKVGDRLVQKRNHILKFAVSRLPSKVKELLGMLSLLSGAVSFGDLSSLIGALIATDIEIYKPRDPRLSWKWEKMSEQQRNEVATKYTTALTDWNTCASRRNAWFESEAYRSVQRELTPMLRNLSGRGLLLCGLQGGLVDLHPVVRGVIGRNLKEEEVQCWGKCVVQYFSNLMTGNYDAAVSYKDITPGLHVIRALMHMKCLEEAYNSYRDGLTRALCYNLEDYGEVLSIMQRFFSKGWHSLPRGVAPVSSAFLANEVGNVFRQTGELERALEMYATAIPINIRWEVWVDVCVNLANTAATLCKAERYADEERCRILGFNLSALMSHYPDVQFSARLGRFQQLSRFGLWQEAEKAWTELDGMGRDWARGIYRKGNAEYEYAVFLFWQGKLKASQLKKVEEASIKDKNRPILRLLFALRGEWHLSRKEYGAAIMALTSAVEFAREKGWNDGRVEGLLLLARLYDGRVADPTMEMERISGMCPAFELGELWRMLGNVDAAAECATAAFKSAFADGEPYVHRYRLEQAEDLMSRLGIEVPDVPRFDPNCIRSFPWESDVRQVIERLKRDGCGGPMLWEC